MAQLEVMISGGFQGPYTQMLPSFEKTTGIKVVTKSGASQGSGPKTIKAQLLAGTTADVVILSREGLTELIAMNKILLNSVLLQIFHTNKYIDWCSMAKIKDLISQSLANQEQ